MRSRAILGLAVWGALLGAPGAGVAADPATQASKPAPLDWNDAKAVHGMMNDLADADFAVRERGERVLATVPLEQSDKILGLADRVTDEEVKARLLARVDALERDAALTRPGITADFKDAALQDVAAVLSAATGTQIGATAPGVQYADERYSLHVKDMPFWQVVTELGRQHPVWLGNSTTGFRLLRDPKAWTQMQWTGGVCVAMDAPRKLAGAAAAAAAAPLRYSSGMAIAVDPRIALSEMRPPAFTQAVDQAGGALQLPAQSAASATAAILQNHLWPRTMSWMATSAPESVTMSGTVTLVLGVPDVKRQVVVENASKRLNEPITMGQTTVQLQRFDVLEMASGAKRVTMLSEARTLPGAPAEPAVARGATTTMPLPILVTIEDAKGKTLCAMQYKTGVGTETSAITLISQMTEPVKMVVTPMKPKEVTVPFDFQKMTPE